MVNDRRIGTASDLRADLAARDNLTRTLHDLERRYDELAMRERITMAVFGPNSTEGQPLAWEDLIKVIAERHGRQTVAHFDETAIAERISNTLMGHARHGYPLTQLVDMLCRQVSQQHADLIQARRTMYAVTGSLRAALAEPGSALVDTTAAAVTALNRAIAATDAPELDG